MECCHIVAILEHGMYLLIMYIKEESVNLRGRGLGGTGRVDKEREGRKDSNTLLMYEIHRNV